MFRISVFSLGVLTMLPAIFSLPASGEERPGTGDQNGARSALPLAPATLLEILPDLPADWELLRSEGRTLLQGHHQAFALREYRQFIPPERQKKEAPPQIVIMAIRDTCGQGTHLEPFSKESSLPLAGEDLQIGQWKNYPALLVKMGENRNSVRILISNRFIVELVFPGEDLRAASRWLNLCNLRTLASAKQEYSKIVRERVILEFIDQVNPSRDRRYSALVTPETQTFEAPEESEVKKEEEEE